MSLPSRVAFNGCDSDHSPISSGAPESTKGDITLQTANTQKFCVDKSKSCAGPCPGYGACIDCPPLIVLAVLSVQPTEPSAGTKS